MERMMSKVVGAYPPPPLVGAVLPPVTPDIKDPGFETFWHSTNIHKSFLTGIVCR